MSTIKWILVNCIISLIITSPFWGGDAVRSVVGYEMGVGILSMVFYLAHVFFLFIYGIVMVIKNQKMLGPLVSGIIILGVPFVFRAILGIFAN